jgi:hypothetical protein
MTQMQTQPDEAVQSYGHWPGAGLRAGFGVIWLIDATLKWLPGFRSNYMDTIIGQADGQPGWVKPWLDFRTNIEHPYTTAFAYVVAVLETVIAVALIVGFARKLTYIGAIGAERADLGHCRRFRRTVQLRCFRHRDRPHLRARFRRAVDVRLRPGPGTVAC